MSGGYRRPRMSAGMYLSEKTAPYVAPWLLSLGAMPVAVLIHFTLGSNARWMIILSAICTLITLGTWFTWKHHKHETRLTATLFVGVMFGWIVFSATGVPWRGDMLRAWAVGGFGLSVFWCIRHAGIVGGHDRDRTDQQDSGGWLAEKISAFKNSKVTSVKESPDELRIRHDLDAPTTAGDAQRTVDQIAAVAGVGKDQVKVLKVKGDESKVDVVMTRGADTSKPVRYRGPSAPGQSCAAAPLWLGRRTDGSDIEWWMAGSTDPADPRQVSHTKVTGVPGSGKTETICTAVLDMRWRTDIVPIVGDPAKFQQSFGDIEECLGLVARTKDQVLQLFENLAGPVVEYRAGLLGSLERSDGGTGYKQWEPECYTRHGVPFVFVDIEEAADVLMARDEEVYEAVRKLRSVGVKLVISTQTMPHDDIPRKVRGQFVESLAHGQNEYQDAKYSLSSESLEANADPTKWRNDAPGSLYAEVTGTDRVHWPVDGRAAYMSAGEKHMSIEGSRQFWAELDPGTYSRLAFGITEAPIVDVSQDPDLDGESIDGEEDIEMSQLREHEVDPHQPLAPPRAGADIDFTDGEESGPPLSTEAARQRLQNRLDVLANSGQLRIKAGDLADLPVEVGRSPGWLYENLHLLVAAGVLKELRPPEGGVLFEIVKRYPEAG